MKAARQVAFHLILAVAIFAALAPFVWMLLASFKTYEQVIQPQLLPTYWSLAAYREVLTKVGFGRIFGNSLFVAVPGTASCVLSSAAAGYVFSKYRFPGRDALFTAILATLMVPFTVVIIPLYITMGDLGLIDDIRGLLLTSLCSTFGIFLMRQSIADVPDDYIDAARIDGASEWWIFGRVIVPLVSAPLGTLAVFSFLGLWDNYLWPSILLRSADQQTLPMAIASLRSLYIERYHIWSAGAMLTVVPVMTLFSVMQRYFTEGLALAGLKG